jgi:hypothetical protein
MVPVLQVENAILQFYITCISGLPFKLLWNVEESRLLIWEGFLLVCVGGGGVQDPRGACSPWSPNTHTHTPAYSMLRSSLWITQIKSTLKGRRFEDTEGIKRNITKELLALYANGFKKCFQQFYERAQKCVTTQGDYFEEYCHVLSDYRRGIGLTTGFMGSTLTTRGYTLQFPVTHMH